MQRESIIGLFVLCALVAMGYFVLRTGDRSLRFWEPREALQTVYVELENASGIREGTSVRIAGVKVGKVAELRLEGGLAVAVLSLPVSVVLKDDAQAKVRGEGVLGDQYIALDPGIGSPVEAARLRAGAPPSLDDVTATIKLLGDNLLIITEAIKQSTINDRGDNRLAQISANIESLTGALVKMLEENRANVLSTSGRFADLTGNMNRDIPVLIHEMTQLATELRSLAQGNRGHLDHTAANVSSISGNMSEASKALSSIAQKVDSGQGSLGKLINDQTSVDKLNQVLDQANESLGQVRKFLGKANDLQFDMGVRADYLTQPGANKTYFGIRIAPDDKKYYLLEGVTIDDDLVAPEFSQTTETSFDADGNLISTTVSREEKSRDDFLINAQLAYKFGPVFLRAGLLESEGGGGIDYFTPDKRYQFSMEAFDFSRDDLNPHARVDVSMRFYKGLRFNLGWDDLLESGRDSAVVGAGLRWKDEDLKLLFGSLGRLLR